MAEPLKKKPQQTTSRTTAETVSKVIAEKAHKEGYELGFNTAMQGIGETRFVCLSCGKLLTKEKFYLNNNPLVKKKITCLCKECVKDIALRKDPYSGNHLGSTIESIRLACEVIDVPFLPDLYEASSLEISTTETTTGKTDPWSAYVKNVKMNQYKTKRFKDSEFFKETSVIDEVIPISKDKVILEEYERNKEDTIRLLGYDPFRAESIDSQPFMYSQLIGYLDAEEDGNKDMMRISSIIEIIKGFDHRNTLNDLLSSYLKDKRNLEANMGMVKTMEETKAKIGADLQKLARESNISTDSNKTNVKGSGTWTGKLKMLKEKRLRSAEENAFDVSTCDGMRQVAELSDRALIERINLDESLNADIIAEQRKLLTKFKYACEDATEAARILLRENHDLKELLQEQGIDISDSLQKLPYELHSEKEDLSETVEYMKNFEGVDRDSLYDDEDMEETLDEDIIDDDDEIDELLKVEAGD